jgi:lincosamide nucleotidyltransferase A/C/D/E
VGLAGRGREPQSPMDADRVLDLLAVLATAGIPVWLDGGWAIDALLGEQTRQHDDLDLVARLEDSTGIEQTLRQLGYALAGGGSPLSFELVDADGHQVDVHPAAFNTTGDGIYKMEDGTDWIFPAVGFNGVGRIQDRQVPTLTPEVVLVNHTTGYALDEQHQRDVEALCAHYRIPIPRFRRV